VFEVDIPLSYRKDNPPKPVVQHTAIHLFTKMEIINVDSIDTINMIFTLTTEIRMKWHDKRLAFLNPFRNQENVVPHATAKKIWIPLDTLTIENAIIGEIKYDEQRRVQVYPKIPELVNPGLPNENRRYNGSYNLLEVSQQMKVTYNCKFHVYKFPFDEEKCYLVLKINRVKNTVLTIVEDEPIAYNGPAILDQFEIGFMTSKIENTHQHTKYTIIIPMNRIFTHQLLRTFIPTFIFWLLGYSTLFIDTDHPGDRFKGSVTVMLVLTTLINIVNGDLPSTSYMKLIDFWFVWHIVIIFVIIIYHILLERMIKHKITFLLIKREFVDVKFAVICYLHLL
jgi:hypothetical protein